jgi:hypothetical protein
VLTTFGVPGVWYPSLNVKEVELASETMKNALLRFVLVELHATFDGTIVLNFIDEPTVNELFAVILKNTFADAVLAMLGVIR